MQHAAQLRHFQSPRPIPDRTRPEITNSRTVGSPTGNLPEAAGPENRPVVPAVRASDADRERVAAALQAAFAEGLLTMPELEERLTAACAAETDAELATILHDLRASAHHSQATGQARHPPR